MMLLVGCEQGGALDWTEYISSISELLPSTECILGLSINREMDGDNNVGARVRDNTTKWPNNVTFGSL